MGFRLRRVMALFSNSTVPLPKAVEHMSVEPLASAPRSGAALRAQPPHRSFPSAASAARQRVAAWLRTFALAATTAAVLSACGGGNGSSGGNAGPAAPAPDAPIAAAPDGGTPDTPSSLTPRTLVIDLDGATYGAVQAGIAAGTLPHLAKLQVRPAYSGGVVGTPSQQPTLDTPGWATLLTGTWASRHEVLSEAPKQGLHAASMFQMTRAKSTGLNGAAVATTGLAQLLASDHEAGFLDALTDCSQDATATDCVTRQAAQWIAGDYSTVLAQYRAAKVAALDHGLASTQYAGTLAGLDQAVGALLAATAQRGASRWLVIVTGNHGLSANSQDDGLPLLPESSTFIGLNQPANIGTQGIGAALPQTLADLYAFPSIADVAPTVLGYLDALPPAASYALDGGRLLGAQPVSQLTATVAANNSSDANVVLTWVAPPAGAITVLRDGQVIAALPAGTGSYTDNQLSQVLSAEGTYQMNYGVQAGDGADAAARATLSPPVSYRPPVPLAASLTSGLVSYYPFSATLPPVDAMAHSSMAPAAADLPAAAGLVVPGPLPGTHGLLIDTNFVTTAGLEGYRLTPAEGFDIAKGTAPQFTLGFWFKTPTCISKNNGTIISNKSYVSGGNAGVAVGMFSGSSSTLCGIAFNIGSGGGVRADGPTSPYTQITLNRWVYIAFSVDGVAKTMNMVVFDPVTGTTNRVATGKSTGSVDLSKLSPYPQWGIGDDGTGTFLMNKCGYAPPYYAGRCTVAPTYQEHFGDLAMWNRVLTDAELQSIFLSNKPLSTLLAN